MQNKEKNTGTNWNKKSATIADLLIAKLMLQLSTFLPQMTRKKNKMTQYNNWKTLQCVK